MPANIQAFLRNSKVKRRKPNAEKVTRFRIDLKCSHRRRSLGRHVTAAAVARRRQSKEKSAKYAVEASAYIAAAKFGSVERKDCATNTEKKARRLTSSTERTMEGAMSLLYRHRARQKCVPKHFRHIRALSRMIVWLGGEPSWKRRRDPQVSR